MENEPSVESLDLDDHHFVSIEMVRQWPKYVVTWAVRRRAGDTDYPVQTGTLERMPPPAGEGVDDMLASMREEAIEQARQAAGSVEEEPAGEKRSFLDRLRGH